MPSTFDYEVGVIAIPYPRLGCIITKVSKVEKTYLVSIAITHNAFALTLQKMLSKVVTGKEGSMGFCKHMYYVFRYVCKVDYITNKFIHAPTINYNKVLCLLELMGVVEQA